MGATNRYCMCSLLSQNISFHNFLFLQMNISAYFWILNMSLSFNVNWFPPYCVWALLSSNLHSKSLLSKLSPKFTNKQWQYSVDNIISLRLKYDKCLNVYVRCYSSPGVYACIWDSFVVSKLFQEIRWG